MNINEFDFNIPEELIAQNPADVRSESKLLVYYREKDRIVDSKTANIADFLDPDYFMIFNNSRVIPARVPIRKYDNDRIGELLLIKIIDKYTIEVITDKTKKYRIGCKIILPDNSIVYVDKNLNDGVKIIKSENPIFSIEYFNNYGNVPLPPYIKKQPDEYDKIRYQTTFGKDYGSSAAPTAGLHFDERIFNSLDSKKIEHTCVSLHVGLGTFQPIYTDNILEHKIHSERISVSKESADKINNAISNNKKILPVGTTSLRTIESAYSNGKIIPCDMDTDLYIYPSYKFKVTDAIFTNFHTPKSSLFILISAFVGTNKLKEIYKYAVDNKYRFFSYGDAMLIL